MFRRFFEWWRQRQMQPERLWKVSISNDSLEVIDQERNRSSAQFQDIQAIVADMAGDYLKTDWWLLDGKEGCALAFPWGAQGEREVIEFFEQLPGFDWEKLGQATRSIQDASFVVWKRKRLS